MEMDSGGPDCKVVELNALKTVTPQNVLCQSTAFEASTAEIVGRPQSALSERMSELSGSSLTSISTASSSDLEEHRHLCQSLTSLSLHDYYSSFCSTCSDSDLSCSTLEGDSFCNSSFTEDSGCEEVYSDDDDGHYKLIQPPYSGDGLEFWTLSGSDDNVSNSSFDELESSLHKGSKDASQENDPGQNEKKEQEEREFCMQCHTWPEVEDCRDPPRKFYEKCHHTRIDPLECAFGTSSIHKSTVSLNFVEETPVAVAKRKAMESVLRTQFRTLIQQFSVNPEKVARTLYGISVIDIIDLGIATAHVLPELERATVLTVTLVRRLRRWPDLFGDVCKVLSDIPAVIATLR